MDFGLDGNSLLFFVNSLLRPGHHTDPLLAFGYCNEGSLSGASCRLVVTESTYRLVSFSSSPSAVSLIGALESISAVVMALPGMCDIM